MVDIDESFVWVERDEDVDAFRSRAVSLRRARAAGKADEGVGGVDGLDGIGECNVAAILPLFMRLMVIDARCVEVRACTYLLLYSMHGQIDSGTVDTEL